MTCLLLNITRGSRGEALKFTDDVDVVVYQARSIYETPDKDFQTFPVSASLTMLSPVRRSLHSILLQLLRLVRKFGSVQLSPIVGGIP